jgi:hypothetical protein
MKHAGFLLLSPWPMVLGKPSMQTTPKKVRVGIVLMDGVVAIGAKTEQPFVGPANHNEWMIAGMMNFFGPLFASVAAPPVTSEHAWADDDAPQDALKVGWIPLPYLKRRSRRALQMHIQFPNRRKRIILESRCSRVHCPLVLTL